MTLLGEPIATWISIGAFLISLSTVILALRKHRKEDRVFLANQIADIKREYGGQLLVVERALDLLKEIYPKSLQYQKFLELKQEMEKLYKMLGHQDLKTVDPVILSSIAIENKQTKERVEQFLDDISRYLEKNRRVKSKESRKKKSVSLPNQPFKHGHRGAV